MTRVVATVGTDHHPYARMLDWMSRARADLGLDVIVQRGATSALAGLESVDYLPADDLASWMRDADAVVCHGGPGTISLALRTGHRPIVMARNPAFGEHVDDHQMRYVARLAAAGTIDSVTTYDELVSLLGSPRPRSERGPVDGDIASAVAAFSTLVGTLLDGTLATRPLRSRLVLRRQK